MFQHIISKIMKKSDNVKATARLLRFLVFLFSVSAVIGQEVPDPPAPLPDNINKIVSASCMPCHSSSGGTQAKSKLNFSEWTGYPAEEQKNKAQKIYKEVKKKAMPPKSAREDNPEIIPTREQINVLKSWANSF
jgi:hypothetical protein